jgi:small-conductance mechanosensitive channel
MRAILDNLAVNWALIVIPIAVFIVSLIALFWLRKRLLDYLAVRAKKISWMEEISFISSIKGPLSIYCLIISVYLGLAVSSVPAAWKHPISNGLWTLFIIALTITLLNLTRNLINYYGNKQKLPNRIIILFKNIARITILILAVLVILELWGVPITVLLLLVAVLILVAILAFRDSVPNLLASFQIAATQEIKVGDYIKLEGVEEGYVTALKWDTTRLKGLDGSIILIPNNILIRRKVVNYGRPLKKASEPFRFNTHVHLAELTGLKAKNLIELLEILKKMPDSVIYYHTHHVLEENQAFHPELSNDFSNWVKHALDNDVLAEKLANLSTYDFNTLLSFRDKVVDAIQEYVSNNHIQREALDGTEFYFMKSVSVVLPTAYQAHDLREFIEALRKISPRSLYFHIFESRLRLGNKLNDFSVWLEKNLDEGDISQEIARIDPHTYTLEGLRSLLIQIIEKHIK